MWLDEAKKRQEWSVKWLASGSADEVIYHDAPRAYALLERAMVLLRQYNYSTPLQFIDESNAWLRDLEGKEAPDA